MKIIDLSGEKIKACFMFVVGNCDISVSTIINENKPEIAIFEKHSGELLQDKISNIGDAISWVNSFGPRD